MFNRSRVNNFSYPKIRYKSESIKWGLLADTHFKEQSLESIVESTSWAVDEFKKNNVSRVFLLGDILNTRQMIHVGAQSAAMQFIGKLINNFPSVHVIIGNHDMHLRHSRSVTSLDALSLPIFSDRLKLYKQIELVEIDNFPVLMLPYHQNEEELQNKILEIQNTHGNNINNIIAMAHLSINGAVSNKNAGMTYQGFLETKLFKPFKRTFSGHFHSHQTLEQQDGTGGPVTYVGSPLQFNYGDINDEKRGAIIFEPNKNQFQLLENPHAIRFIELPISQVTKKEKENLQEKVNGKFILLSGLKSRSISIKQVKEYETAKKLLYDLGALNVRRALESINKLKESQLKIKQPLNDNEKLKPQFYQFSDLLNDYISYREINQDKLTDSAISSDKILQLGNEIMKTVDENELKDYKVIFEADIDKISIENFLGVGELQELNFKDLPDGVWYIQGSNGAGKSTIAEAITWCLFGQLIRSDTKADYVINDKSKKNCRVRIDYKNGISIERFRKYTEYGGSGFRIYRDNVYQEELDKGNREASQSTLENMLGIEYQNFIRTVALADDTARNFVSATAPKRRQIIEDLLGFGKFEQYLIYTRQLHRDLKSQIQLEENEISHFEQNLHNSQMRLSEFKKSKIIALDKIKNIQITLSSNSLLLDSSDIFQEDENNQDEFDNDDIILDLQNQLHEAIEDVKYGSFVLNYRSIIREFQHNHGKLNTELCHIQVELANYYVSRKTDQIHDYIENLRRVLIKHSKSIDNFIQKYCSSEDNEKDISKFLNKIQSERELMSGIIDKIKEKCDKEFINVEEKEKTRSPEVLEPLIQDLSSKLSEMEDHHEGELEIFFNSIPIGKEELLELEAIWDDQTCQSFSHAERNLRFRLDSEIQLQNDRREQKERKNNDSQLNSKATLIENRKIELKSEINALEREIELYDKYIQQEQQEILKMKEHIKSTKDKLVNIQNQQEIYHFWELAFGKAAISVSQKNAASVYSMRDYVFQDSLKELNITLKQSLEYLCDDGVNYHDLDTALDANFSFTGSEYGKRSSGERRRTALALFFALVELTRARSTHQTHFIVLDEIFDALDSGGQDAAHRLIQRLQSGSDLFSGIKKVFVITHSPITAGLCHSLRVEKSPSGTEFFPHPLPEY